MWELFYQIIFQQIKKLIIQVEYYGVIKAVIAPIVDILQPTRKENAIGNLRINTMLIQEIIKHMINENDKTKITNREMTTDKINMNYLNVQNQANNNTGKYSDQISSNTKSTSYY